MENGCQLPLWVLLFGHVSQLLMITNSSINFFIYCLMSSIFREVFYEHLVHYFDQFSRPCSRAFSALKSGLFGCSLVQMLTRNQGQMDGEESVTAAAGQILNHNNTDNVSAMGRESGFRTSSMPILRVSDDHQAVGGQFEECVPLNQVRVEDWKAGSNSS